MIISHKYRFIFIKTKKTAGTSIEVLLSSICADDDVLTPIYPLEECHRARNYGQFYNHISAVDVRGVVGEALWGSYLKFCVERNPWDKVISHYYMTRNSAFQGGDESLTLGEHIDRHGQACVNFYQYCDESGRPIVDRIIQYDQLSDQLGGPFEELEVPFANGLDVRAKGSYRLDRRHYREILTTQQASRIADLYDTEIKLHGYAF